MYDYAALVVSVFDGDTIRADIDLGLGVWKRHEPLRLFGINAPELRGETMAAGKAARDALRSRILEKYVRVRTIKDRTEKYGRYLAVITDDLGEVNQWLVESGHAVRYSP